MAQLPVSVLAAIGTVLLGTWLFSRSKVSSEGRVDEIGDSQVDAREILLRLNNREQGQNQGVDLDAAELESADDESSENSGSEISDNEDIPEEDRARRALEAAQLEQAGQEPARLPKWKQRGEVGAKKARSLARREQRRAYFEFVRQRAEEERERHRLEEQMFGDIVAEEQAEREARIEEARLALEDKRAERRKAEEAERQQRHDRGRELSQQLRDHGFARLEEDGDAGVAASLNAIIVSNGQAAVEVTPKLVAAWASILKEKGRATFADLAESLPH